MLDIETIEITEDLNAVKIFLEQNKDELTTEQIMEILKAIDSKLHIGAVGPEDFVNRPEHYPESQVEKSREFLKICIQYMGGTFGGGYVSDTIKKLGDVEFEKECAEKYKEFGISIEEAAKLGNKECILEFVKQNKNDRDKILQLLNRCMDRKAMFHGTSMENAITARDELVRSLIVNENILNLPADNMDFLIEVFDKLGVYGFRCIESDLLSSEAQEILGKDTVYDLIKYYKVPGKRVNLGSVLKKSEAFNKYQQFRKVNGVFSEKQMKVMDTYDAIHEFDSDSELIEDCMAGELSEEQQKLLISYLREKLPKASLSGLQADISQMTADEAKLYLFDKIESSVWAGRPVGEIRKHLHLINLSSRINQMSNEEAVRYMLTEVFDIKIPTMIKKKEDLTKFPEMRKEKFMQMIESGDKDAITLLLSGMTFKEYQDKIRLFLNTEQLENVIQDFEGESEEFQKIQATNMLIQLLLGMDEEKRKEVLHNINNDLALQFTQEGSIFADMRQAFAGAEISLRKLYGHDLATELANFKLPESVRDEEKGVDIIKLEGQDFKLIIHGIDVFAQGTGKYESRELGQAYLSASLISEKAIKYIGAINSPCTSSGCFYGFKNVGDNALIWSGDGDKGTHALGINSLDFKTSQPVAMTKTEQLLEDTANNKSAKEFSDAYLADHNEVALFREYVDTNGKKQILTPEYIICFSSRGGITDRDIKEAKRLGIPIVYIDEEKYKEKRQEKGVEVGLEDKKITARDVYDETISRVCDVVPALKQEEGMQMIIAEIERSKENAHER